MICLFSQEETLISSDLEKQAVADWDGDRLQYKQKTVLGAFVIAVKHQKFSSKFPFVTCFYSLETRRKLALKSLWRFLPSLRSYSSERQQEYLCCKGLFKHRAVQLLWGEEWDGPVWCSVLAIKLSCCSRCISKKKSPWLLVVAQSTFTNKT